MATELATAYISLVPSMSGVQGAIAQQFAPAAGLAGAAGDKAGANFAGRSKAHIAKAAAGLGALFAAAKVKDFLAGAVGEARESQKIGALTAQVIKTTGGAANVTAGQVGNLAAALSAKTGVDDEAIQKGSNLLLTFKNVANEAGKGNKIFDQATAAAVDRSAAGFGSIESASIQLGKALNDPVKGMTALGRSGVTFTEAQKKQIEQMVKGGDLLGAQKVLLAEVKSQVGGAAASQATAADKLAVSWGNFKESIGTALLPLIDKLVAALIPVVEWMTKNQTVVAIVAALIGGFLVGAFIAWAASIWAANAALLANPIIWIVVGIVALIVAIVLLVKNFDLVKLKIGQAWDWIKTKTAAAWSAITGWLANAWTSIKTKATEVWDGIKAKIAAAWENIKRTVSQKVSDVVRFVKDLPRRLLAAFVGLNVKFARIGIDIITGLLDGLKGAWSRITGWLSEKIAGLSAGAKKLLGISSPSRVFMGIGENVGLGMAAGLESSTPRVYAAVAGMTAGRPRPFGSFAAGGAGSGPSALDLSPSSIAALAAEVARLQHQESVNTVGQVARAAGGTRQTAGVLR